MSPRGRMCPTAKRYESTFIRRRSLDNPRIVCAHEAGWKREHLSGFPIVCICAGLTPLRSGVAANRRWRRRTPNVVDNRGMQSCYIGVQKTPASAQIMCAASSDEPLNRNLFRYIADMESNLPSLESKWVSRGRLPCKSSVPFVGSYLHSCPCQPHHRRPSFSRLP